AKAFMHHGRARCQVSSQPDPVRIRNSDVGRRHIVRHAGKLVDARHLKHEAALARLQTSLLHMRGFAGTESGPDDIGQQAKYPVEIKPVWLDETVAEQMKPEIRVVHVARRG